MLDTITRLGARFTISRIGLGTIEHCGPGVWGQPRSQEQCLDVLRTAMRSGVNFIDTAHAYGPGVAEALIARALHPYPNDLLIATKGGFGRPGPNEWVIDGRPAALRRQIDESLRRLRVDCIDLWQLHRVDPKVAFDEQLGVAVEAQRAGKIQHFGLSKVDLALIEQARQVVEVASVQNRFNVLDRASDPIVDHCLASGIIFIAWAPLALGRLARVAPEPTGSESRPTAAQLALGWLLQRAPNIVAIPGTTSVDHLKENLSTFEVSWSDADWGAYLEAAQDASV